MKAMHKIAAVLSLGSLLAVSASAKTVEQAYLENCRKDAGFPVPIAVVSPRVSSADLGASVEVEFLVDAKGKPSEISVKSATDNVLADAVIDAVKQWQFSPAQRDGVAVATKVILPVRVVETAPAGSTFAAN